MTVTRLCDGGRRSMRVRRLFERGKKESEAVRIIVRDGHGHNASDSGWHDMGAPHTSRTFTKQAQVRAREAADEAVSLLCMTQHGRQWRGVVSTGVWTLRPLGQLSVVVVIVETCSSPGHVGVVHNACLWGAPVDTRVAQKRQSPYSSFVSVTCESDRVESIRLHVHGRWVRSAAITTPASMAGRHVLQPVVTIVRRPIYRLGIKTTARMLQVQRRQQHSGMSTRALIAWRRHICVVGANHFDRQLRPVG